MNPNTKMFGLRIRGVVAVLCGLSLVSGDSLANVGSPQSAQVSSPQSQAPLIPPDQLDSLVAPIALYPDPLLAQTLAASTYKPGVEGQSACGYSREADLGSEHTGHGGTA